MNFKDKRTYLRPAILGLILLILPLLDTGDAKSNTIWYFINLFNFSFLLVFAGVYMPEKKDLLWMGVSREKTLIRSTFRKLNALFLQNAWNMLILTLIVTGSKFLLGWEVNLLGLSLSFVLLTLLFFTINSMIYFLNLFGSTFSCYAVLLIPFLQNLYRAININSNPYLNPLVALQNDLEIYGVAKDGTTVTVYQKFSLQGFLAFLSGLSIYYGVILVYFLVRFILFKKRRK